MTPPGSQPPRGPVMPDDRRNYDSGGRFGEMANQLKNGWPFNIRGKTSVRVGSGTGLAGNDGNDGTLILSGALAQVLFGNIAAPNGGSYVAGYRNGSSFILASNETSAGFAIFDVTTGRLTQEAERSVSGEGRFAAGYANLAGYTCTFFKDQNGLVHLRGICTGPAGAIAGGATILSLPSGYFSTTNPLDVIPCVSNGVVAALQLTSGGNLQTLVGCNGAYISLNAHIDPRA